MQPTEAQLRGLYEIIQEHQKACQPILTVQLLAEGNLRVEVGPGLHQITGEWWMDLEKTEVEYTIDFEGRFI